MQSPDAIKKGLRCLGDPCRKWLPCSDCDWHGQYEPPCRLAVCKDAIAYIEQLEAELQKK